MCLIPYGWAHVVRKDNNNTSNSLILDCDSISDTDYGRQYCFIRHVNAAESANITIKENDYADVKREIIFDNCTFVTLPLGLFDRYPVVRTVYGWNVGLQKLNRSSFRNALHLTTLDLTKNQIVNLTGDTFSLAVNLKQLELTTNAIRSIDVQAFGGLGRLRILYLDDNRIESLAPGTFKPLVQLHTIRLNKNRIKAIPVELFVENLRLANIYLHENAIEWLVGESTFSHLQMAREFDLHNNPIRNLVSCVINAQSIDIRGTGARGVYIGARAKRLIGAGNRISFVEISNVTTNLQYLDLAYNNLTGMRNLTNLVELTYLDLSYNQIGDIELNSFASMRRLETLKLRHSGLHTIFYGSFSHKSNLKLLDISYNRLFYIDFNMFTSLGALRTLYLEGNNITDMDMSEIRKVFPSLTKIGIAKNNWHCTRLAAAVKYLESNEIALNSIGLVKNSENIRGIPCNNINHSQSFDSSEISAQAMTEGTSIRATERSPTTIELNEKRTVSTELTVRRRMQLRDVDVIIRLIELKYETMDTVKLIKSIADKLQNLLNDVQNE